MRHILNMVAQLAGVGALMILAQCAAWFITKRPVLNVKPFNCRACATFWTTLIVLVLVPQLRSYDALIFAFINFFYIKTQIEIYE